MIEYPFPGMNPYLESNYLWPNIHLALINAIQMELTPKVVPDYYVTAEERTYITAIDPDTSSGRADVAILSPRKHPTPMPLRSSSSTALSPTATLEYPLAVETPVTEEVSEYYLEIRQTSNHEVITVIELLSPANKRTGIGRAQYKKKREQVLTTQTNLIEVDLLRSGVPFDVSPQYKEYHYRILVSRGWQCPQGMLYPFNVTELMPEFPVPLRQGQEEPTLALGELLENIYLQACYDLRIDYAVEPKPRLDEDDGEWLHATLREAGLRG